MSGAFAMPFVAAVLLCGCSGSDHADVASRPDPLDRNAADRAPAGASKALVHRCDWNSDKNASEAAVRNAFFDSRSGEVRLLLADTTVRPGAIVWVAVANDSAKAVTYGTFSHLETQDGERVRVAGPYGFRAVAFQVPPGRVGPCVSLPVPSRTESGSYTAVLEDVRGGGAEGGHLRARFTVAGAPIQRPRWEVALDRAARKNQTRRERSANG